MFSQLAIALINLYQRFLSPHKGYRCAYAVLHNTQGCSGAVKQIVARQGVIAGRHAIRQRFRACKEAHSVLKTRRRERRDKNGCCNRLSDAWEGTECACHCLSCLSD